MVLLLSSDSLYVANKGHFLYLFHGGFLFKKNEFLDKRCKKEESRKRGKILMKKMLMWHYRTVNRKNVTAL